VQDIAWYVFPLAAWTLLAAKAKACWTNRRATVDQAFGLAAALFAVSLTLKSPPVGQYVNAALGPNTAWFLADALFLISAYFALVWMPLMINPDRLHQTRYPLLRPRSLAFLVLVLVTLTAGTVTSLDTWQGMAWASLDVQGTLPLLAARLAYSAYIFYFFVYWSIELRRYLVRSQGPIRARLTLAMWGVRLGALVPALQAAGLAMYWFWPDGDWDHVLGLGINAAQAVAGPLVCLACLPAVGRAWLGLTHNLETQRLYRRLWPLLQLVQRHCPDVILVPAGRWSRLDPRDIDFRLGRAVVEIADGWRQLSVYASPTAGTGQQEAEREATVLASALQRKAQGEPPGDSPRTSACPARSVPERARFYAQVGQLLKL
jgi:hypothetical protein